MPAGRGGARRSLSLTIGIREAIPEQVLIDYALMVLQGVMPKLVKTSDPSRPYYVEAEQGAAVPNLEQRLAMWKQICDRGWGMPVQQVVVDGALVAHVDGLQGNLPSGQLGPGPLWELDAVLQRALAAGADEPGTPASTDDDVIDAECVEPSSASADDDSSDDDDE